MLLIAIISAFGLLGGGWIDNQYILLLSFTSIEEVALRLDLEVLEWGRDLRCGIVLCVHFLAAFDLSLADQVCLRFPSAPIVSTLFSICTQLQSSLDVMMSIDNSDNHSFYYPNK